MDILSRNIAFMTTKISNKLKRYVSAELLKHGVTVEQGQIIYTLFQPRQFNQKQLCMELDKDPVALSKTIDILIRKGLVNKDMPKDDRRAYIVILTETGKELAEDLKFVVTQGFYDRATKGMSKETYEVFLEALDIIDKNLPGLNSTSNK